VLLYATTCSQGPYACPNVRIDARVAYTNHTPASAMRGFGAMQVALGYEGQMDLLAGKLALDPLELRRRNFVERGDTLAVGQTLDTHVALPELADRVEAALGPKPGPSSSGRRVGRGVACNLQSYGRCVWLNDWASAWGGFELDGTLAVRIGVPDIGGGQASSPVQLEAEVLGYGAGHDVGRAINPRSVEGQIEGAVVMGLGFALSERVLYEDGVNLTGTFAQYLIPTAVEAPEIEPIVVESGEGLGPFSARGIGEPPVGAVAPAVAAALAEALGRRLTVLPFTPERVAEA